MKNLDSLSENEKNLLLKYPAYISLLAGSAYNGLNENEKSAAIKISHIKTYSCNPMLYEFYRESDMEFEKNIEELDVTLPKGKFLRSKFIKRKLAGLEKILLKLDPDYASVLHTSMASFKDHVSKANMNILDYFIFPMPIKGINEQ